MYVSREPMLSLVVTFTPLASRAEAYICASRTLSGKLAEPTTIVSAAAEVDGVAAGASASVPPHALRASPAAASALTSTVRRLRREFMRSPFGVGWYCDGGQGRWGAARAAGGGGPTGDTR